MNLFLYQGNNYYNRKIIYAESNAEYIAKGFRWLATVTNAAFIVNDGITTSQVINYDYGKGFGDYLVDYDEDGSILSRWWVTKTTVIRNGQVMLTLLRDVIADWYADILSAPAYIKKGYVTSVNDPAIFNNETMSFNQIKTSERFIKDKTETGWYVGYLAKSFTTQAINIPNESVNIAETYETIAQYPYSQYTINNKFIGAYTDITHNFFFYEVTGERTANKVAGFGNNGLPKTPKIDNYTQRYTDPDGFATEKTSTSPRGFLNLVGVKEINNTIWEQAADLGNWERYSYGITQAHTESESDIFFNGENGKIINVGGQAKRVIVNMGTVTKTVNANNSSVYAQNMLALASGLGFSTTQNVQGTFSSITFEAPTYYVTYEDVEEGETELTFNIPESRAKTDGAPYDLFAIPAGTMTALVRSGNVTTRKTINPALSQKTIEAINISLKGGLDGELYDIQYVPYCPCSDTYLFENTIDLNALSATEGVDNFTFIEGSTEGSATFILYATSASFSKKISATKITVPSAVKEFKIANECDVYRLCSPNYNGQFEFSATKNGGVTGWNISFTYKPFTPYIKVAPVFGRLYGTNFGDSRGLICGGDFSLSQSNDAWISYEIQNKNYQVMFDRQIQNMEVNNSVQRTREIWGAVAGTVQGGTTGGIAGSNAGPWGAIAGAVAGTVASGMAGAKDIALNDKLRAEAIDYAKDQYGYNLQNIKALPYSLTKVGSQNKDYKIWPFVEYYTCTDTEKVALESKLRWNGYSIERVGSIGNFLKTDEDTFIQGKIIRLEAINAGNNITNVINVELQTGVYFT